jgi:hypothetical protein
MWLKLTNREGIAELFNMATCDNIAESDNNTSLLYWFGPQDQCVEVLETIEDLALVLGAIGKVKPNDAS